MRVRHRCQVGSGKRCVRQHIAAFVLRVHQTGKINIRLSLKHGPVLEHDLTGPQHDAAAGIDLSFNINGRVGASVQLQIVQLFKTAFIVPFAIITNIVQELIGQCGITVPDAFRPHQTVKIRGRRNHCHKASRVDDAGLAHRHAFGADKIQIAADSSVFYGVYRTGYVNTVFYQIHKAVDICRVIFQPEIHIGNIPGADFKFLEAVDTEIYIAAGQDLLGIDIVHIAAASQAVSVFIRNDRSPAAHRQQQ